LHEEKLGGRRKRKKGEPLRFKLSFQLFFYLILLSKSFREKDTQISQDVYSWGITRGRGGLVGHVFYYSWYSPS